MARKEKVLTAKQLALKKAYEQDLVDTKVLRKKEVVDFHQRNSAQFAQLRAEKAEISKLSAQEKNKAKKAWRKKYVAWRQARFAFYKRRLFYKNVSIDKQVVEKKRSPVYLALIVTALLFGCSFIVVPVTPALWDNAGYILSKLFTPDPLSTVNAAGYWWFLWSTAMPEIGITILMSFVATAIGGILAIPLFIYASRNIAKSAWVYVPIRVVLSFLRCFPTAVLAMLAVFMFDTGAAPGIFAMMLFSIGIVFKMMYEYIESVDMNPFDAIVAAGGTKLQAFSTSIKPQIAPMYASYMLYTFELNIRGSVVLGYVSAGGIGELLSQAAAEREYDKVGAIIIGLLLVVSIIQIVSGRLQKRLS